MRKLLLILTFLFCISSASYGQGLFEIFFGSGFVVTNVSASEDLEFGPVFSNQGLVQIPLTDPNVVVFRVIGIRNRQIRVTLTPPNSLVLDGNNFLPFTLRAAYNNNQNNASTGTVFSGNSAVFPLSIRNNRYGFLGEAYLYFYGDITVGNVDAGAYSGTTNVFIEYE